MHVKFWGVRGSVPWSTPESAVTGSNTPCVQLWDEESMLMLDAGTGLIGVGHALGDARRPLTLLLSHYHWDHVHGLPFFLPFFSPGWSASVIAPAFDRVRPDWMRSLFSSPHFPITFSDLASPPAASFVDPEPFFAGGFQIRAARLLHPGGSFAYRVTGRSGDLVYATDHEFGDAAIDAALAQFASGAAALILDAHYTPEEFPRMQGRGHGTWRQCAEFAAANRVGQLWLFHHKPGRTDRDLQLIERDARRIFPATSLAVEGVEFML